MKIYCLSGLGADKRVFKYLRLDHEFVPVEWIRPLKSESIGQYSQRLCECIDTTGEFALLGVSFGGLVAVEMSKILTPVFTILISSAETRHDLRPVVRMVGKTGLFRVLPAKFFDPPRKLAHFLFGTANRELLNSILEDTDLRFAKWAVNELANWKNEIRLENVLKIHGTKDRLIPLRNCANTRLVSGGSHLMIVDRATEVSDIINRELKIT